VEISRFFPVFPYFGRLGTSKVLHFDLSLFLANISGLNLGYLFLMETRPYLRLQTWQI